MCKPGTAVTGAKTMAWQVYGESVHVVVIEDAGMQAIAYVDE